MGYGSPTLYYTLLISLQVNIKLCTACRPTCSFANSRGCIWSCATSHLRRNHNGGGLGVVSHPSSPVSHQPSLSTQNDHTWEGTIMEVAWVSFPTPAPLSPTNLLSPPRMYMRPANGDFSPSLQSFSYRRQGTGVLSELEEQKDNFLILHHMPLSQEIWPHPISGHLPICPSPVDWYQSQRPETQPRNLPFLHPDPVIPQVPCIPAPATYSSLPLLYPTTTRPQRLCELPPLALCSLLQSCPYPPPTLSTGTSRQSHLSKTQILPCYFFF